MRWVLPLLGTVLLAAVAAPTTATAQQGTVAFRECLMQNGLVYSPYRDGQRPDDLQPSVAQVYEDLEFLANVTRRIRLDRNDGIFADMATMSHLRGLRVVQVVNLGANLAANAAAIAHATNLARNNVAETLVIGNKPLSNAHVSKAQLVAYLRQARRESPGYVPVTTLENWDWWLSNLDLVADVDAIHVQIHPFWDGVRLDDAVAYTFARYDQLRRAVSAAYPTRTIPIVVGETGWPSGGAAFTSDVNPGDDGQRRFAEGFALEACQRAIPFVFLAAFDEEYRWNERRGGDPLPQNLTLSGMHVGSSWGLFGSNGRVKSRFADLLPQPSIGSRRQRPVFVNGRLFGLYAIGADTVSQRSDWIGIGSDGALRMEYPRGQDWGTVFFTAGSLVAPRQYKDFSEFATVTMELRGEQGGEIIDISIKDSDDLDDRGERKVRVTLTSQFQSYTFALRRFDSDRLTVPDDLRRLSVVAQFLFNGHGAQTVYVRNIEYRAAD